MKTLLRRIDPLRLVALVLLALPPLALVGLGTLWLWEHDALLYWLAGLLASAAAGYGLQYLLHRRERRLLAEAATEPNPDWSPRAEAVWGDVEALADGLKLEDWPLNDSARLMELARLTLERVSRHYHPKARQPLLQLTVPHTLLILERASRDLRRDITEHIPFSHRLRIGDLLRAQRWKVTADQAFLVYRMGRAVINPLDALANEAWRNLRNQGTGLAQAELHGWLLRAIVRKVGYYAIDLYSGRLPLEEGDPTAAPTPRSRTDLEQTQLGDEEPLRILVFGRTNAGKSSLINALFGQLVTAADTLADTTRGLAPYRLEREGLTQALVIDTPGCDGDWLTDAQLHEAAADADLILWASPAHRPDRQVERACLDALRTAQAARPEHHPPPLIVAATHIDLLRPAREWQPPYDLQDPSGPKATNIAAAVAAIAADLAVPVEQVVPVALAAGRVYNVDDGLWAKILDQHEAALRTRLLRCLAARRRAEDWELLRRQMIAAGRLLTELPQRFKATRD
ncbi:putative GTPase [Thioflavicoccus mobilis 8321]|uniref:Putative GTPase n=1 Tax=Thioflavicoccus mobilis 8321 TaxID=765912 RepID=L0GWN5_9GAMM|nr:GTPase domain-containing protein [Thioflavicoccus mobilis]AGA89714.1 putative GTPase [Thioflavicoccus mobilis 8321]